MLELPRCNPLCYVVVKITSSCPSSSICLAIGVMFEFEAPIWGVDGCQPLSNSEERANLLRFCPLL